MSKQPTKKTDHIVRLLSFSEPFNPKTDDEAQRNGFAFNKLASGDRDYRLGVLLMAIALTLRRIEKAVTAIDSTGLDVRDELQDMNEMFSIIRPPAPAGGGSQAHEDQADDGEDQADDDDGDDDDGDGDGEDHADDGDDDEPEA
jgi:hypothetical protein